jgi:hypothetical protein
MGTYPHIPECRHRVGFVRMSRKDLAIRQISEYGLSPSEILAVAEAALSAAHP